MRGKLKVQPPPIAEQGKLLSQVVRGLLRSPCCADRLWALAAFRDYAACGYDRFGVAVRISFAWERIAKLADDWLPHDRETFFLGPWSHTPTRTRHVVTCVSGD